MAPLQAPDPAAQRERIVRTQPFDIRDLEVCILHGSLNVADGIELCVGKDVAIDELEDRLRLQPEC